ncbi:MAG TPA: type I-C CRISPR-associated protein Cas8c/Csd1 [Fibrobacteria bacterium]|nr:type I-C CRISPR-associated protein Cas8c/Csd1 [Fibrobacteria bacterium]
MSWIHDLYETSKAIQSLDSQTVSDFWPVGHVVKMAHVEVVLNASGQFRRLRKLDGAERLTLIPTTESSAGRTGSKNAPHPLCDEIGYCASDFPAGKKERFNGYFGMLEGWVNSPHSHPKAKAILTYIKQGVLWKTLQEQNLVPFKTVDAKRKATQVEDGKVFVRWRVEEEGNPCSGTWEDPSLIQAWIYFEKSENKETGFCMASGEFVRIARNHPRFIRNPSDGAKIISSNDFDGYTFRGRFTDSKDTYGKQALSVGYETSQLAHSALRWLVARQGYRSDDQVFVAWATGLQAIPDFRFNTKDLFGDNEDSASLEGLSDVSELNFGDIGQGFAKRLNRFIAGYRANLEDAASIIVMGLDSATLGRLAITFYRKITGSEFLERLENWHRDNAWPRKFGRSVFPCAPAPTEIAHSAFGKKVEGENGKKLHRATIERLVPCIIDGYPIPNDLVESCVRRASHRLGFKDPLKKNEKKNNEKDWEDCLAIACALFRGTNKERKYAMSLEENRVTRDYLFGRLLAIAEHIEQVALRIAGEKRDTNAAKLMQRYADRPASTWMTLSVGHLPPYHSRVRAKWPGCHERLKELLDGITVKFLQGDFLNDTRLNGEFLLGYHCQRQELREKAKKEEPDVFDDQQTVEGDSNADPE